MISSISFGAPIHLLKFAINLFLKDFPGALLVYKRGSLNLMWWRDIGKFSTWPGGGMTRSVEELKREIEDRRGDLLRNGEIVDKMKERAFYIPFMAMGSSLMTLYIGKRLLQAKADNPLKRPLLFQFGN